MITTGGSAAAGVPPPPRGPIDDLVGMLRTVFLPMALVRARGSGPAFCPAVAGDRVEGEGAGARRTSYRPTSHPGHSPLTDHDQSGQGPWSVAPHPVDDAVCRPGFTADAREVQSRRGARIQDSQLDPAGVPQSLLSQLVNSVRDCFGTGCANSPGSTGCHRSASGFRFAPPRTGRPGGSGPLNRSGRGPGTPLSRS